MTLSTYPISNGLPAFNLGPSFLEYAIQREVKMASIKENLIAARALIDTNKGRNFNPLNAIRDSVSGERNRTEAYIELREVLPDDHLYVMQWLRDAKATRADVMALFDRAIAAQDEVA